MFWSLAGGTLFAGVALSSGGPRGEPKGAKG